MVHDMKSMACSAVVGLPTDSLACDNVEHAKLWSELDVKEVRE